MLRLDEEIREIEASLRMSKNREMFQLVPRLAVRPKDVQKALLDFKPQVVHFCGHGAGEQGLILEDNAGHAKLVSTQALAQLFSLCRQVLKIHKAVGSGKIKRQLNFSSQEIASQKRPSLEKKSNQKLSKSLQNGVGSINLFSEKGGETEKELPLLDKALDKTYLFESKIIPLSHQLPATNPEEHQPGNE
ncbi:hypothetical protein NUACC21_63260 [Scytonema sp. NUACC21]